MSRAAVEELETTVAVIGAGPAGSTLAVLLAARGIETLIIDRDSFPRDKLCGEFLSWDALPILERIGALEAIDRAGARRIVRCSVIGADRATSFDFPEPARGISRLRLDEILLGRARAAGAKVLEGWSVTRIEPDREHPFLTVRRSDGKERIVRASVLAGAWGRWGRLDMQMQRPFVKEQRGRHFGFKRHYEARPGDDGEIRLYGYDRGYLGVSPVEGEQTNICGLVHGSRIREMKRGWPDFVSALREERRELDELFAGRSATQEQFLSSDPVIFTARDATVGGAFLVGDAAGIIDPLVGNGMAMGIQSALLAAGSIVQRLSGGRIAENAEQNYRAAHSEWFGSRIRWSRRAAWLLSHPRLVTLGARLPSAPALGRFFLDRTRADLAAVERLLEASS
jgi:menaquinone-9 beta-reductase